jgi:hypothetical protein
VKIKKAIYDIIGIFLYAVGHWIVSILETTETIFRKIKQRRPK